MKKHILSLDQKELGEWLISIGEAPFRGRQIFSWIYSNFTLDPGEMKTLPAALRSRLAQDFITLSSKIPGKEVSDDQTEKLLVQLHDGNAVESVVIRLKDSVSFCISTQVGCPVKCFFCASGADGLERNLEDFEITEQFIYSCRIISAKPDNIVFMGIGEPLMNYSNLMSSVKTICDPAKFAVSPRKITISTSGFVPGILKLAKEGMPLNLAISLHAPDDKIRSRLIPPKFRYGIDEIGKAAEKYLESTGRIVTLEYVLLDGINESQECASELAKFAKRIRAKINIIPYNPNPSLDFKAPNSAKTAIFEEKLRESNVPFTRRVRRGSSVNAACGQLRRHAADGRK